MVQGSLETPGACAQPGLRWRSLCRSEAPQLMGSRAPSSPRRELVQKQPFQTEGERPTTSQAWGGGHRERPEAAKAFCAAGEEECGRPG